MHIIYEIYSLIWDKIAYNAKVEKGEVQDVFADIMDEDSDEEGEEVLCVEMSDYYSFKELIASYPVLLKIEGGFWWSLLKRSRKESSDPDNFAFGQES